MVELWNPHFERVNNWRQRQCDESTGTQGRMP